MGRKDRSGHLGPIIRPMWLVRPRRGQRWQPIRRPRIITAGVVHPTLPRCIKLAAWAGTVGINGTRHLFTNFAFKADAAARFGVGADHGNAGGVDLYHQVVRHNAPGRLAFAPEEGHTEVPAAGAAVKARVIFGHDGTEGRLLLSGLARAPFLIEARSAEKRALKNTLPLIRQTRARRSGPGRSVTSGSSRPP